MSLESLSEQWLTQKRAEEAARDARIRTEEAIIELLGALPDEGTRTHKADGYKIRTTSRINRRLDESAWLAIVDDIPEELRPIRYKAEIDNRGLSYLREHEPAVYGLVSRAIEAKPGKVGVVVESVEAQSEKT
jgi:hypothetical protein